MTINQWGINKRQADALDAFILTGNDEDGAKLVGTTPRAFRALCHRATKAMPGDCRLHKLIAWRDYRGLLPDIVLPPAGRPFGLTEKQAMAFDLWSEGLKYKDISAMMSIHLSNVSQLLHRARGKIPGERDGQKQAAWRRACNRGD